MTEFRCPSIPQWISEFYPHHRLGLNDAIETCVSGQVTPLVAAFTCERHSSPRYALTSVRGPWSLLVQRQHLRVFDLSLDGCPRLRRWERCIRCLSDGACNFVYIPVIIICNILLCSSSVSARRQVFTFHAAFLEDSTGRVQTYCHYLRVQLFPCLL